MNSASTANIIQLSSAQQRVSGKTRTEPRLKILFVDDEERILNSLRALFRRQYDVTVTVDGYHALELLKREHFHLLVSDQRMPAMLGVDLLQQARSLSPNTVRILLTGFADLAAIVGSVNEGEVYRYINKPWNNEELQEIISGAVSVGEELAGVKKSPAEKAVASVTSVTSMAAVHTHPHTRLTGRPLVIEVPDDEEQDEQGAQDAAAARLPPLLPLPQLLHPSDIPPKQSFTAVQPLVSPVDASTVMPLNLWQPARAGWQDEPAPTASKEAALLFLDREQALFATFQDCGLTAQPAFSVATPAEALQLMQRHAIGVIVASIDGADRDNVGFMCLLKKEHPHVVLLAVARLGDSETTVELVNAARVFRVIFYPLRPKVLRHHLDAALKQVDQLKVQPALLKVQQAKETALTRSLLAGIGTLLKMRMKCLRGFFSKG